MDKEFDSVRRIATFEKISEAQFDVVCQKMNCGISTYDTLETPKRATAQSAGYDFYTPVDVVLSPGESVVVPTLMRCRIDPEWALFLFPKSGLGFKYNVTLANTIGVVDADYYNTKNDDVSNEGHIMVKLKNLGNKTMKLTAGSKFCQGIFLRYGITTDDEADGVRNGGFGSTGA